MWYENWSGGGLNSSAVWSAEEKTQPYSLTGPGFRKEKMPHWWMLKKYPNYRTAHGTKVHYAWTGSPTDPEGIAFLHFTCGRKGREHFDAFPTHEEVTCSQCLRS